MTYGQLRLHFTQAFPDIHPELIETWIQVRYRAILDQLDWSHLNVSAVIETVAPFSDGTVALTPGSAAVALTGGAFTTQMSGREFRVDGRPEIYSFRYLAPLSGQLDREYEGPATTAIGYKIFQRIYDLPANCRLLEDDALIGLERWSRQRLNGSSPTRPLMGKPQVWASHAGDSGALQVELYPIPDAAIGIPYTYISEADDVSATTAMLPFVRPGAILAGVTADCLEKSKDYTGADRQEGKFVAAVLQMQKLENRGNGPIRIQMADAYTRHRRAR